MPKPNLTFKEININKSQIISAIVQPYQITIFRCVGPGAGIEYDDKLFCDNNLKMFGNIKMISSKKDIKLYINSLSLENIKKTVYILYTGRGAVSFDEDVLTGEVKNANIYNKKVSYNTQDWREYHKDSRKLITIMDGYSFTNNDILLYIRAIIINKIKNNIENKEINTMVNTIYDEFSVDIRTIPYKVRKIFENMALELIKSRE